MTTDRLMSGPREGAMHYYIRLTSDGWGTVHKAGCPRFLNSVESNRCGPYASRGAAIDAVISMARPPWECSDCIKEFRVNVE